jgi:hypothetical protein
MVCEKCQKELDAVICPDVWKDGARNTTEYFCILSIIKFHRSGGRKINENKLLNKNKK